MGATRTIDVKPGLFAGKFIVLDGPDGSGKDYTRTHLVRNINMAGTPVVVLNDPGGTGICNTIRRILLDKREEKLCTSAELMLFMAARAQLLVTCIVPALADGLCVLCSRWIYSTIAYQGYGRRVSMDLIKRLHLALSYKMPDQAVFFDVPVNVSHQRCVNRGDLDRMEEQFEVDNAEFFFKVGQGYRDQAMGMVDWIDYRRILLVDGTKAVENLADQVWRHLVHEFSAST